MEAAGISTAQHNYGPFFDKNIEFGSKYFYRLKSIDLDGKSKYSDERKIETSIIEFIGEAEPNPASNNVKFIIYSSQIDKLEFNLYNQTGEKVNFEFLYSNNEVKINTSVLINGTYFLKVKNLSNITVRKFEIFK